SREYARTVCLGFISGADTAFGICFEVIGSVKDQSIESCADRHDYTVDIYHEVGAFYRYGFSPAGSVRLSQFHLHALDTADMTVIGAFYGDRIGEISEVDAFFNSMVDLLSSCRNFRS